MKKLKEILGKSKKIVFLTGAGLSTASGIPDFRSSNGIYKDYSNIINHHSPEEVLSRTFFDKYTEEFFQFYFDKMIYQETLPNNAHLAIAKLEETKKVTVITQNIDGLHQMAGSTNVLELHGGVISNHCMKCHRKYSLEEIIQKKELGNVPICSCGGIIKPDVVLYEEPLDTRTFERAIDEINNCDSLIVCGTSLLVNPAAGLVRYFRGENFVIINLSKTPYDQYCDLIINEPVEQVLQFILGEENAK